MISLFLSSVRPHFWQPFLDSLRQTEIRDEENYEVVMAGPIEETVTESVLEAYPEARYIKTADLKPAQCYEIARRECKGELVGWCSDDCIFEAGALDKIYDFFKENLLKGLVDLTTEKAKFVIALKNIDSDAEETLDTQRFFSRNVNTPQNAVIGFMSRNYLERLGGLDRRYVIGKWEMDICMRVLADGGKILKLEETSVQIEHTYKNGAYNNDWSGDNEDGYTLENSWVVDGYKDFEKPFHGIDRSGKPFAYYPLTNREISLQRFDKFEPYEDKDLLTKSQSHKNHWV